MDGCCFWIGLVVFFYLGLVRVGVFVRGSGVVLKRVGRGRDGLGGGVVWSFSL